MALFDAVSDLVRRVAREELLTRFQRLSESDVRMKGVDDIVTTADTAAEFALEAALTKLLPGSVVVGEEAAHDTPEILRHVASHESVWVVDPLDGTRHFAAGEGPFGVAVGLLHHGIVQAGWIYLPLQKCMLAGDVRQGVSLDGAPVTIPDVPLLRSGTPLRGAMHSQWFPPDVAARIDAAIGLQRTDHRDRCSAQHYVDLVRGRDHFALFDGTLPWDHAAGTFLVRGAGGVARRLDGSEYMPGDERSGLLVAASDAVWQDVNARLFD